jgi:hypothetical protein
MNWRIWLIITELLFGLCGVTHGQCPGGVCPAPQYGQQLVPVPKQSSAPAQVVRIYNQQGNGSSIGSGTLVDKNGEHGLILSCAHLFTDGIGTVTVVFPDGKRYGAKVLEADKTADLSALLIRAPEPEPWQVADRAPKQGEPIYSAGYGQQGQYAVNAGTVKGYVGWGSDRMDALSITGNARQGDSGGPMFDRNHQVVAVLCGTSGMEVDGPCCLRIRKFLQRHCNRFGKPATPPKKPTDPIVQGPPADAGNGCQCGKGCECDPAAACKCDLSPLEKRITELTEHNLQLEKQLALLEKRQPTPTALLDAAKKEPITVQILDPSGKVKQESKTYLGGTLRFQLKPVKKSG